jgi:hypothetical protein
MLPTSDQDKMEAAFRNTLRLLTQVTATWSQVKPPNATAAISMAVRQTGKDDIDIVNSHGEDVTLFVAEIDDFPESPAKYDRLEALGEVFIIQAIKKRFVGNRVFFVDIITRSMSA